MRPRAHRHRAPGPQRHALRHTANRNRASDGDCNRHQRATVGYATAYFQPQPVAGARRCG